MTNGKKSIDKLLEALQERAKELGCLYQVEEILMKMDEPLDSICSKILKIIPPGWQYPDICQAKIEFEKKSFRSSHYQETSWELSADITVQDTIVGTLTVSYTKEMPEEDDGPFLKEEAKLIQTIAERLGNFIMHQKMRQLVQDLESARDGKEIKKRGEWQVVLEMLKQTDQALFLSISRKMLNHLCWSGITEAEKLHQSMVLDHKEMLEEYDDDWNMPHQRRAISFSTDLAAATFKIAAKHLSDDDILRLVQKWVQEDKLSFLVQVVNRNLSLSAVADAIRRHHHLAPDEPEIFSPSKRGIQVSLIRRFLSDQLQYINIAKNFIRISDFYDLLQNVIFTTESHGKLGGKSAGLYLAAMILKAKGKDNDLLADVKIPKTWHITSDVLLYFMHYNDLDEVVEQKYKEINQVRLEYPHIVQSFKNARFPGDIVKGLSVALDDFSDQPLIVRSSSLLEDRMGAAFSGKYKSLFLANQGSKKRRLEALMDAIAEVYASTFSPDPIEYRHERGLIDFGEEMGIMIQECVGTQVGKYFLPTYAGVAFSRNEFRWSPRIKREDGLLRLVPGLGTRAVDRLSDDYPILIAPGQPNLQVNVTTDEIIRYSPKKLDVINLETNSFETVDFREFMREVGYKLPGAKDLISIVTDDHITKPTGLGIDYDTDELIATFQGMITGPRYMKQMDAILKCLEETLKTPVDIEFASDGRDFYLLQCRPQSFSEQTRPSPIPKNVPPEKILFSATRHISNGRVPDITHIVYVDPKKYAELPDKNTMMKVGRAVSKLNEMLPKRQFVLIGPGRWGSRGDIKLGVNVTYSDINNTAALIEVAVKKGDYVPDLSFGTHFFQDLVEADIRYLPLYPFDDNNVFNDQFLIGSSNLLAEFAPEYESLSDVVHLIDVPRAASGQVLRMLFNADLEEAVGILDKPRTKIKRAVASPEQVEEEPQHEEFWHWRLLFAERIAAEIEPDKYGVNAMYVFGSTKNATAGPGSDIDLLIHFGGSKKQREQLLTWLDGWSRSLGEMNYLRTGYRCDGLLDIHIVTDKDIEEKTSYASKIGAVTDPARPLRMGPANKKSQK